MARILIVDDEVMRDLFFEIVSQAGHEATTAATSQDGNRLVEEWNPDLVITDVFMPEEGGFEVIRKVKLTSTGTRVIAISGFDIRTPLHVSRVRVYDQAQSCFEPSNLCRHVSACAHQLHLGQRELYCPDHKPDRYHPIQHRPHQQLIRASTLPLTPHSQKTDA